MHGRLQCTCLSFPLPAPLAEQSTSPSPEHTIQKYTRRQASVRFCRPPGWTEEGNSVIVISKQTLPSVLMSGFGQCRESRKIWDISKTAMPHMPTEIVTGCNVP